MSGPHQSQDPESTRRLLDLYRSASPEVLERALRGLSQGAADELAARLQASGDQTQGTGEASCEELTGAAMPTIGRREATSIQDCTVGEPIENPNEDILRVLRGSRGISSHGFSLSEEGGYPSTVYPIFSGDRLVAYWFDFLGRSPDAPTGIVLKPHYTTSNEEFANIVRSLARRSPGLFDWSGASSQQARRIGADFFVPDGFPLYLRASVPGEHQGSIATRILIDIFNPDLWSVVAKTENFQEEKRGVLLDGCTPEALRNTSLVSVYLLHTSPPPAPGTPLGVAAQSLPPEAALIIEHTHPLRIDPYRPVEWIPAILSAALVVPSMTTPHEVSEWNVKAHSLFASIFGPLDDGPDEGGIALPVPRSPAPTPMSAQAPLPVNDEDSQRSIPAAGIA